MNFFKEQTIYGPIQSVRSLAVLKDDQLVSGSYKTIQIWNITNGNLIQTLDGSIGLVHSIISLNDGHLVSCSAELENKPWYVRKKDAIDGWNGDVIIRDIYNPKKIYEMRDSFNKINFYRTRSLAVLNYNTFISHYLDNIYIYKTVNCRKQFLHQNFAILLNVL